MRITIDTTEPLPEVLRVLGAAYGVGVAVIDHDSQNGRPEQSAPDDDAGKPAQPGNGRRRRPSGPAGNARRPGSNLDTTAVRRWARDNGYTVSDRGRIADSIVRAYLDADGS